MALQTESGIGEAEKEKEKKKTSRQTTFTTLLRKLREPFPRGATLQPARGKSLQLPESPAQQKIDPCTEERVFCLKNTAEFRLRLVGPTPTSLACVSRRVATMGVKVGGVESPESHRRLDLQINGSGFHEAFKCCWKKQHSP